MNPITGHLDRLRDGWVLTGHVDVAGEARCIPLDVRIDGRPAGTALANGPRSAPPGATRLAFEFPLRFQWQDGQPHEIVIVEPISGQEIGRITRPITVERHYRDMPGFLAWMFHHRVLPAPFNDIDRICLAFFDAQADRLAAAVPSAAGAEPLVSILMPTHNAAASLPAAIGSVLAQTLTDWELIIIDDASQDGTNAVLGELDDPRICCLKLTENGGPALARQVGLAQARGRLVAYLDADNHWDPRFLAVMAGKLLAEPDRDAAFCGQYLHHQGAAQAFAVRFGAFNPALNDNESTIDINCLMHCREAGIACGGFNRQYRRLEDWDFVLRLTAAKAPLFVPVVLSHYRVAEKSDAKSAQEAAAWRRITGQRAATREAFQLGDDSTVLWAPPAPVRPRAERISIVIPSFEIPDTLTLCVARVMATIDPARVEVILCDNGSGPQTIARLKSLQAKWPMLRIEYLAENAGFTHAANRGMELAGPGNHVVLLNNDAIVMEGWLEALLDVASRPDAGIIAPRQMLLAGTPTIAAHAPAANEHLEIDVSLSAHHANVLANAPVLPDGILELNFVPFFCVLLTRPLLDTLGPLDARRGRHYRSDSLYCLATREVAGRKILYTPHAKVYHLLQQSTHALRTARPAEYTAMLEANRHQGQAEPWDLP